MRAGLFNDGDNFHFHALRHFAVSAAIARGLPLTDAPSFIGHKDLTTTLGIYTHSVGNNRQASIVDAMATALLAAPIEIEGTVANAPDDASCAPVAQ